MTSILEGKAFTWAILSLYGLRCLSYATTSHWGRAAYWLCAAGITVSAEFLISRWP